MASEGNRRRIPAPVLAVVLLVVALATACSSDGGSDAGGSGSSPASSTTVDEPTTTTTEVPAPPEPFTGSVDDFYVVPDPLPAGEPGDLIRLQPVAEEDGRVTVRVMYHSLDVQDQDRAVTGVISYPTTAAPEGGWPVLSWAHGTSGLSSACAPSRVGAGALGPDLGVDGVHVATDYIGLGPVGERHGYLSGVSEAHAVVDAVRAARRLPEANAGTTWAAAGHSQGGHAALFTNELGAEYAPELDLRGTVAYAPASVLDKTFGPQDQVVPKMVGVMALYGLAADHPEIDPRDYVGDEVAAVDHTIDDACADDVINAMVGIPAEVFYDADPLQTEPARSIFLANDPGHVAVESPLLVVYGTVDTYVVPDRVAYLFNQLCEVGQVTVLAEVEGADHGTVVGEGADEAGAWLADRLAGEDPPNACG